MFKKIIFIYILCGILVSQNNNRFNFSIGAYNERQGQNLINFSYNFYMKDNHEVYASIGAVPLFIYTVGIGWKKYFTIKNRDKIFPFISLSTFQRLSNKLAVTNGTAIREDDCIYFSSGISLYVTEVKGTDINLFFQIGGSVLNDFRNEIDEMGFINFEFRF